MFILCGLVSYGQSTNMITQSQKPVVNGDSVVYVLNVYVNAGDCILHTIPKLTSMIPHSVTVYWQRANHTLYIHCMLNVKQGVASEKRMILRHAASRGPCTYGTCIHGKDMASSLVVCFLLRRLPATIQKSLYHVVAISSPNVSYKHKLSKRLIDLDSFLHLRSTRVSVLFSRDEIYFTICRLSLADLWRPTLMRC